MKFKNIKKKKYKKSPRNSRTITESKRKSSFKFSFPKINHVTLIKAYGGVLKFFVVFIFIVAVVVVGYDLQNNLKIKNNIDSQRGILIRELSFWEDFISKHQDYRDAYFQASILEFKLGNTNKAKMYAEKGLSLDPNSQDGERLQKFLTDK